MKQSCNNVEHTLTFVTPVIPISFIYFSHYCSVCNHKKDEIPKNEMQTYPSLTFQHDFKFP